jgi:hypothetical protein
MYGAGFTRNILTVFVLAIAGYERSKFALKTMVFLRERCGDRPQKDFLEF